jgi:hypothetical protein
MRNEIDKKLEEIYKQEIVHETIHDSESVRKCMNKSYELGKTESEEKYNKLKKTFLELLENWGDFGNYNSGRHQMEEEWKKEGGLI